MQLSFLAEKIKTVRENKGEKGIYFKLNILKGEK